MFLLFLIKFFDSRAPDHSISRSRQRQVAPSVRLPVDQWRADETWRNKKLNLKEISEATLGNVFALSQVSD
jgi:hypothetical protein